MLAMKHAKHCQAILVEYLKTSTRRNYPLLMSGNQGNGAVKSAQLDWTESGEKLSKTNAVNDQHHRPKR